MTSGTTRELLREGEWTNDGRMLTEGTVTWLDQIPLMTSIGEDGSDGQHLVGAITNIRREGHRILGDLSVDIGEDMIVTCEVTQVDDIADHGEGRVEFTGARLVGATITTKDKWPWS